MTAGSSAMPAGAAVALAHAALQTIAEDAEVDILHIKGPALDDSLLETALVDDVETGRVVAESVPRRSMDADVLVRPSHIGPFIEEMARNGWYPRIQWSPVGGRARGAGKPFRLVEAHFEDGSAFEHDAAFVHPFLGQADVHRLFPGIRLCPEEAFERLWCERRWSAIAGYPCWVPSVPAQRLILILHAAREGSASHPDIHRAWTAASGRDRRRVESLAVELQAEVALGAGTGRLGDYVGSRDHDLWRLLSSGERSLASLWLARVRSAPTVWGRVRTGARLIVPTPRRIAVRLRRAPTRRELFDFYLHQGRRGMGAIGAELRRARGRS